MRWAGRRGVFREILSGSVCVFPASVHDPLTARIAKDIGFEASMLAGSTASQTILAEVDNCTISLTELVEQTLRISRASDLPLIVDGDHGYGNAFNVIRTVEELEIAGAAAITIEDTELPQNFGDSTRFISIQEAAGKIRAAIHARQDPALTLIGRTTLDQQNAIEQVMMTLVTYADLGVDAVFISGIKTFEQIATIAARIQLPIMLGASGLAVMSNIEMLSKLNVRVALQGHHPIRASIHAIYQTFGALRNGVSPADLQNLASETTMQKLMRQSDTSSLKRDLLGK